MVIYYKAGDVFAEVIDFTIASGKLTAIRTKRIPATPVTAATGSQLVTMNSNPINGLATWTVIARA